MPDFHLSSIRATVHASLLRAAWLVRRLPRIVQRKDLLLTRQATPECHAIGKGYGTWYVVPKLLKRGDLAFCFGLGREISFERALAEDHGMEVHAFDPTPHSLEWLAKQAIPASMVIHPLGIADIDGVLDFAPPAVDGHVSMSAVRQTAESGADRCRLEVRTLPTLLRTLQVGQEISVLKMDVEGAEFEVLPAYFAVQAGATLPPQISIELHGRGGDVSVTMAPVMEILRAGYVLIARRDNLFGSPGCCTELTFALCRDVDEASRVVSG
jgi:FkbM family methyltransferase